MKNPIKCSIEKQIIPITSQLYLHHTPNSHNMIPLKSNNKSTLLVSILKKHPIIAHDTIESIESIKNHLLLDAL